jgi:hypothetical protein
MDFLVYHINMKHPSRYYIKYLILEDVNVNEVLAQSDLPQAKEGEIRSLLSIPEDFDYKNKSHKPTIDWLKKEKIYDIVYPDKYTKEAIGYLDQPSIKDTIQSLLIAKLPALEIAKKLNSRWQLNATGEGIDRYRHYFWDIRGMRFKDWADLFRDPSERTKIKKLSSLGAEYALQTEGFIQKIETKEALREVQTICHRAIKELSLDSPTPDWCKSIALLAQTITKIDDTLNQGGESNREVLKRFEHLSMEAVKAQVKSVKELTAEGGTYTSGELPPGLEGNRVTYTRLESAKKDDVIDVMAE